MTPEQRSMRSRQGGYALMAKHGPNVVAARARKGFLESFERKVDPDNVLPEAERKQRAQMAMRQHMAMLASKRLANQQRRQAS